MTGREQSMAYVGEYVHQLDARNRVTVPSSWRVTGDDGNYYFAWPDPEGCITIYPPEVQQKLMDKASQIPLSDVRGRTLLRKLFGKGHQFGCDKQGRILLPEELKAHAGIKKQVSLVGLGHYIQIWDAAKRETDEEDFDLLAAMAEIGI